MAPEEEEKEEGRKEGNGTSVQVSKTDKQGFSLLLRRTDKAVLGYVLEVTSVLEPRSSGRDVVGG